MRMLTVVGPGGRTDVTAAADASLGHLIPLLVEQVGDGGLPPSNPRWALYDEAGRPLSTATLVQQRVTDGDIVVLSCTGPPERTPFDDAAPDPAPEPSSGPDPAAVERPEVP